MVNGERSQAISKMPLVPGTRCIFATAIAALSLLLEPSDCLEDLRGVGQKRNLPLAEDEVKIFLVTLLALGFLIMLGLLGCLCCFCRSWEDTASITDDLDIYAPRTQSIVWPTLPQETARIREVTFLHTPKAGCLCQNCHLGRLSLYIENCGVTAQCK